MKRAVGRVIIAGVLGVTISVATAWTMAALADLGRVRTVYSRLDVTGGAASPVHSWLGSRWSTVGTDRYAFSLYSRGYAETQGGSSPEPPPIRCDEAPYWVVLPSSSEEFVVVTYGAGLPWRCMTGWVNGSPLQTRGIWKLNGAGQAPVSIPVRPIWPGLIGNTLVCGGALWVVIGLPAVVRRHRRLPRGACLPCGYDLSGASGPCPECGAAAVR